MTLVINKINMYALNIFRTSVPFAYAVFSVILLFGSVTFNLLFHHFFVGFYIFCLGI